MDAVARGPRPLRRLTRRRTESGALSPIESLSPAWDETLHLLFRPFIRRRWVELSIVCLFLGGGTSTAAFQWGFGSLPVDLHVTEFLVRVRTIIAGHVVLMVLAVTLIISLILGLIYARCVLRFVLIDAVIRQNATGDPTWKFLEPLGRGYFFWLGGVLGTIATAIFAVMSVFLRYLSALRQAGYPSWVVPLLMAAALTSIVLMGLSVAVLITLTDDLVCPLMYAERIPLHRAWKLVWKLLSRDPATTLFYLVLRFALSTGISMAVLVVLFPILMAVSSGALVGAALLVMALRTVGWAGVWSPLAITLGLLAMGLLTLLIFALLSLVGMPGQVYLQNYGVRFMASRVPSLGMLCRASRAPGTRY